MSLSQPTRLLPAQSPLGSLQDSLARDPGEIVGFRADILANTIHRLGHLIPGMAGDVFGQCQSDQFATGSSFLTPQSLDSIEQVAWNRDGEFHATSITRSAVRAVRHGDAVRGETGRPLVRKECYCTCGSVPLSRPPSVDRLALRQRTLMAAAVACGGSIQSLGCHRDSELVQQASGSSGRGGSSRDPACARSIGRDRRR